MSNDALSDVRRDLVQANRAMEFFQAGLQAFQAHIVRFDFVSAETEREKMHASLDDYIDAFASAQKRMDTEHG